jgi:hypothetical protein
VQRQQQGSNLVVFAVQVSQWHPKGTGNESRCGHRQKWPRKFEQIFKWKLWA